jgi:hypothetical protein
MSFKASLARALAQTVFSLSVLDQDARIHHHGESGGARSLRSFGILDA